MDPHIGGDDGCYSIMFAWALGGGDLTLPTDVGFPVGDDVKSEWTHFLV
jgi:hypothetical protein